MLNERTRVRVLSLLLRIAGTIMVAAFLAMLMPVEWMVSVHRAIGLGDFPRAPVVEYLARSASALYGFHGVLLLIISRDPIRHDVIVRYVAIMNVLFGLMFIAIDVHAGMPALWTLLEGPPVIAFGIVLGWLNRRPPARLSARQPAA